MQKIFPVVATLLSIVSYFSLLPNVVELYENRLLDKVEPLPLIIVHINAFIWFLYGYVTENRFLLTSNIIGFGLGIFYLLTTFSCTDTTMEYMFIPLILDTIILSFINVKRNKRRKVYGIFANVLYMAFMVSPIVDIITSNEASYTPFLVVNFIGLFMWTVYGVQLKDNYITIPSFLAFIICCTQIVIIIVK